MFQLKPISKSAIPAALAKAERYRLLNEPREAESICEDILQTDPENQNALVTRLLAITDQFGANSDVAIDDADDLLPRLDGEYARTYYAGIVYERWGKSLVARGVPGFAASDWLRRAMDQFERAESLAPRDNDDAVLRWNACARTLIRQEHLTAETQSEDVEPNFDDEVPVF